MNWFLTQIKGYIFEGIKVLQSDFREHIHTS